ncbi:MAG: TetR/AcrR family transcriptional regulator [Clostridiales bacterium]|nr:TetR/AcrR family transcriptional regulator [Clostridiales bacterium]
MESKCMAAEKRTRSEINKSKILHAAAKLFLEKGYSESTVKEIATAAGVNLGSLTFAFKNKEAILCELVGFVLEGQFEAAARLVKGVTEDKVLFYAVETVMQLYMAESSEHMREMYAVSYSLPHSAQIIYRTITGKLEHIFKEYLPKLESKDFYEREIASGGIMRGFMTVPCDMYFTMERKIRSFLQTTFLVYEVPQAKIDEAIAFVGRFDLKKVAEETIEQMLKYLESKT